MDDCVFCHLPLPSGSQTVTLGVKGCEGIARASEARNMCNIHVIPGQVVHIKCRSDYINPNCIQTFNRKRAIDSTANENEQLILRSAEPTFSYKEHCLFCGKPDIYGGRKTDFKLIPVRTMDFKHAILKACEERQDQWAGNVKAKVVYAQDLHAADAVYHKLCSGNFRTGKQVPGQFVAEESILSNAKRVKCGRPEDSVRAAAFIKVADYLEKNDEEQTTISDLIEKMREYMGKDASSEPYGHTHMQNQIMKHFGDQIIITEINGKSNVVTFCSTAANIIHDFHFQPKSGDCDTEKFRVIETAAKLIKNDIKNLEQSKKTYPTCHELSSAEEAIAFLPETLQYFFNMLFVGKDVKAKIASVGQAIMQATRPRVIIAPLQLGLGVQMHHHFASKFLIDSLHAHGFCCSYSEVQRFERSAAILQGTDIPEHIPDQFVQYVADNVDHNVRTLDGKNTFHGMGIIAAITPATKSSSRVPRVIVTSEDIAAVGRVNIRSFISECTGLQSMPYEELPNINEKDPTSHLDFLWKISPILRVQSPRPVWSGMMQMIHQGNHPGKASVMFLPMIDMNPNDMTCIYSTLRFVCSHAKRYDATPIITFDQPLWWKAFMIVKSEHETSDMHSIVVRLGGFHTEMSFLGCIGHLMAGSGFQELLEVIYAGNTVTHILTGKAVARAVRGHFLVDRALNTILSSRAFGIDMPYTTCSHQDEPNQPYSDVDTEESELDSPPLSYDESRESGENDDDLQSLATLYDELMTGGTVADNVGLDHAMTRVYDKMQEEKQSLQDLRTGALWFQYMEMIDILRTFLKAERTGNWKLHLQSMYDMLPYFVACGHNLYGKSVYIYLQQMLKLHEQHPDAYRHFTDGLHVVRRSDRFWAGLSPDLIIEQVLMRSIKTNGGLTRGRGMTETQRLVWVLSTPACAEVNNAMQDFTSIAYRTSEQHKDMTQARQSKDMQDIQELLHFLTSRNPFHPNSTLRSIATGVTAHNAVNADKAKEVGKNILKSMEGKKVLEYSFKKKDQVVTLGAKSSVKIRGEVVQVDSQLLFQRLVTAGTRSDELADIFRYELCTYPPALFEGKHIMRPANKATLADALWALIPTNFPVPTGNIQYVLDGGALLHRIPWQRGKTWEDTFGCYTQYVVRRYGKAIVVFDGYKDGPSTKDCTHLRRGVGCAGATVHFTSDMLVQTKKEDFLSNEENKQRFLNMLSDRLERIGCDVFHAKADADLLIVQTAIASAVRYDTVLVGDDTDLLVLLCYHAKEDSSNIFFKPEPKHGAKKPPRCWNVKETRGILGADVCDNLLFVHAILGCDTTSRVFGIGKRMALSRIRNSGYFRQQAQVFNCNKATKDDIIKAGENALVSLYNGKPGETIDELRLKRFCEKVSTRNTCVQPQTIPPTSAAVQYHSQRVYLQIQEWKSTDQELHPDEWGWMISEGKFVPIQTHLEPAPQTLLEIIRCNCKTGCNTMRCTCRKNGLECSSVCGECRGICTNMTLSDLEVESDDELLSDSN